MTRYRLRTLLILLAVGPPLLAGAWFVMKPIWLDLTKPPDVMVRGVPWKPYGGGAMSVEVYRQRSQSSPPAP